MRIDPHENELIGNWVVTNGSVHADDVCKRIERLASDHLQKIAFSKEWGAWETLFRDPNDGRFWEKTYPKGHMNGGGPPSLRCISESDAKQKYHLE